MEKDVVKSFYSLLTLTIHKRADTFIEKISMIQKNKTYRRAFEIKNPYTYGIGIFVYSSFYQKRYVRVPSVTKSGSETILEGLARISLGLAIFGCDSNGQFSQFFL